jgi:Tol biopolymer transport system component
MFAGDSDWSADGEWIVFSTYPLPAFNFESRKSNLYRMHPDGSAVEQLTRYDTGQLRATQPRYTPDGKWILFTAVTPSSRSLRAIPSQAANRSSSHPEASTPTALGKLRLELSVQCRELTPVFSLH